MAVWTWEPDDFAALWFGPANDRFPRPLHYRSRFEFRDEFRAHAAAVRERYGADELEQIEVALGILSASEARVEILGGTTRHNNPRGGIRVYRIVGARADRHAVVLAQATVDGEDGPILCRRIPADALPERLVGLLPACEPGASPAATFHPGDLRPARDTYLEDNSRNTPLERYRRLVRRPSDGGGSAALFTGPVNRLTEARATVQWHDLTDDGRYTEQHGDHITVRPTRPRDLAAHFAAWFDDVSHRESLT